MIDYQTCTSFIINIKKVKFSSLKVGDYFKIDRSIFMKTFDMLHKELDLAVLITKSAIGKDRSKRITRGMIIQIVTVDVTPLTEKEVYGK